MRRLNQRRELLLAFKKLRRSAGDLSVDRGRFEDVMLCLFRHRIRNIQATATATGPPSIGRSRESCVARCTSHVARCSSTGAASATQRASRGR